MKLLPDHYKKINQALNDLHDLDQLAAKYKEAGLSEKRFRWDALWQTRLSNWLCDNVYPYANDDHIDTALRHYFRHSI
jgi:hypothetical protein